MMQPETTVKRGGGQTGTVDRLSALPDALLHAILFFLPAPQVVRTCLLSQRWRYLWRSAPRIRIDEQDFGISSEMAHGTLGERWAQFEDFATNLLLFRDSTPSLDEFLLSCHVYNQRHVDRWIRCGIVYRPATLHILIQDCSLDYDNAHRFKLPPMASSSFHLLKMLRLHNVDLESQFADKLSACPFIEDLELKECKFTGNYSQVITSLTLKKMVLSFCENNTSHPLVITTPNLTYLCLTYGWYNTSITLSKMDSLVEAVIEKIGYFTLSPGLIGSLSNVASLDLNGFEAEDMFATDYDTFPIFRNMRTLCLSVCFTGADDLNDKLNALERFLQNTPCLEKLILQQCMFTPFHNCERKIKSVTLQRQGRKTLQCRQLKLIEVVYEDDHDHQLIQLLWWFGRRIPGANIKVTMI